MSTHAVELDLPDLPHVQGRHRNRVLASRRRTRAVQLITDGMTYQQAADTLGYASGGTVHRLVQQALQGAEAETVQDHRRLSYERLEALLEAVWTHAMAGELPAVGTALRVVQAEVLLLGLQVPSLTAERAWSTNCGPMTVVVSNTDCRHAGCDVHGRFDDDVEMAPNPVM